MTAVELIGANMTGPGARPTKMSLRSLILPVMTALFATGCATSPTVTSVSQIDLENDLTTKTRVYCDASNAALEGRGSAGGIGPAQSLTAGGYVANAMMMGMAPLIAMKDRQALEGQIRSVLEHESDGREMQWQAPNSGETVTLKPGNTRSSFRIVTVPRSEEVGRTPDSFKIERGRFITRETAALRPSPTVASDVAIDRVPAGRMLNVYGRVRGVYSEDWYMVGVDGRAIGYMEPKDLRPAGNETAPRFRRITGPALRDRVSATVTCRELTYVTANGEETVSACRTPEGRWAPRLDPGERVDAACLPVNSGQFLR